MSKFVLRNNKQLGVPFIVNGEPTMFRFGGHALAELEGSLGMTQYQIFELATCGHLSVRLARGMLWAALLHDEPEFTLAEAGDALSPYLQDREQMGALTAALASAFMMAFPKAKEGEEPKNVEAPSGTGTTTSNSAPESA